MADTIVRGASSTPVYEDLATMLIRGNIFQVPTGYGWTAAVTNSGTTAATAAMFFSVATGTTANSTARLYAAARGFSVVDGGYDKFNTAKKLYMLVDLWRSSSDAQAVAHFHLKTATTEGVLAQSGMGIQIDNLALKGESYGSELGTVDLNATLTNNTSARVAMVLYPGSKIEWYVNGNLSGTQSTAAKIPTGEQAYFFVYSIKNGAAGGVNAQFIINRIQLWQEL